MNLLQELKTAYRFSIKGIIAKITLVLSVASCVRLAIDIFHISLHVHLSKLLYLYQAIFHNSLDRLFNWLPVTIPPYSKDIALLYFLIGFTYQKVVFVQFYLNYHNPWIISNNFRNSRLLYFCKASLELAKAVVFWPTYMKKTFTMPFLVVSRGEHELSSIQYSNSSQVEGKSYAYLGDSRLMMLIRLAAIIAASLLVIILNYAWGIYRER
jgi:hypothetical protein